MTFDFLQVRNGDAIHIEFKDKKGMDRNILIDSGPKNSYETIDPITKQRIPGAFQKKLKEIIDSKQKIDLLIITHVDDDHIGGVIKWFEDKRFSVKHIKQVWFNSGQLIAEYFNTKDYKENHIALNPEDDSLDTGIGQGVTFEKIITEANIWHRKIIKAEDKLEFLGIKFNILSPSKNGLNGLKNKWEKERPDTFTSGGDDDYYLTLLEHLSEDKFEKDSAPHNGSSIAFIMTYEGKDYLFLADAHSGVVINSLEKLGYSTKKPLEVEFVKVAHHGSKKNTSNELLRLIDSKKYIISSNGDIHDLPNKQCLARIINIHPDAGLYFNYKELDERIFLNQDFKDFPYFKILDTKDLSYDSK